MREKEIRVKWPKQKSYIMIFDREEREDTKKYKERKGKRIEIERRQGFCEMC